MICKFEDVFLLDSSWGVSTRFQLNLNLTTLMPTEFDGSDVLISILEHVFRVIVFLQSPFIWFSYKLISSSWQETVFINLAEQVGVEIFSKAINTTQPTARKAASHIHLYLILHLSDYFSLSGRMPNVPFQWIQVYSSLIRENDLIPVYIICSLSPP